MKMSQKQKMLRGTFSVQRDNGRNCKNVRRYPVRHNEQNEELLEVNLNNDVIKNALDRYRSFENTFLNKVTVMALKELLEYRETGLTPDQVDQMSEEISYLRDSYNDMTERYNEMLYDMQEGIQCIVKNRKQARY